MKLRFEDKGGRPRNRETILASKPKRKPLSGGRDILTVENLPRGYHFTWVNDVDNGMMVERYLEAGYEFVNSEGVLIGQDTVDMNSDAAAQGSKVSRRVGTQEHGEPLYAFLMAIEEEFFEEDQKREDKKMKAWEAGLKPNPELGQYGKIEISRGR